MPPIIEHLEGIREYRRSSSPRVLLDTNILIHGCEGKSAERALIQQLCAEFDVYICDTVYWEFLRNTAIERFRERREEIARWNRGDLLAEDGILREGADVSDMHARLFLLLLHLNARDPRRVLRLLTPDLWIAAVAVTVRHDHILTTNRKDFPGELFEEVGRLQAGKLFVYLLRFQRSVIRNAWARVNTEKVIAISCSAFQ